MVPHHRGPLGGHWVQGHVDGTTAVVDRRDLTDHRVLAFAIPQELEPYLVEKGSITVDGVSLTVSALAPDRFEVALIPHTLDVTTLLEETGMDPSDVDTCMRLGAGHPMGPLALLDLVGLDVSHAIGETIGADVPARLQELVSEGALGRKSGRGFHTY